MRQTLTERVVLAIKVEMLRQDLSTADLAGQLGESYLWLNRRLKRVTPFLLEDVQRVADALRVPLTHLIAGDQVSAA
jgi:transcriptional regulator with XRE-family HTH domain